MKVMGLMGLWAARDGLEVYGRFLCVGYGVDDVAGCEKYYE